MRVRSLLVLSVLVAALGLAAPRARAQAEDAKAAAVADRVMEALGGTDAWNKTRYLRFDFAVDRGGKTVMRRSHTWDKWTGRYRLEATTREGAAYRGADAHQHQRRPRLARRAPSSRATKRRSSWSRATRRG